MFLAPFRGPRRGTSEKKCPKYPMHSLAWSRTTQPEALCISHLLDVSLVLSSVQVSMELQRGLPIVCSLHTQWVYVTIPANLSLGHLVSALHLPGAQCTPVTCLTLRSTGPGVRTL